MKLTLTDLKGERVGFNAPLSIRSRSTRQKVNKKKVDLNNMMKQLDLTDCGTYDPIVENTLFSSAYGTFTRIDRKLGHKTSLNKFKKIEVISSIFSDHNRIKLE